MSMQHKFEIYVLYITFAMLPCDLQVETQARHSSVQCVTVRLVRLLYHNGPSEEDSSSSNVP